MTIFNGGISFSGGNTFNGGVFVNGVRVDPTNMGTPFEAHEKLECFDGMNLTIQADRTSIKFETSSTAKYISAHLTGSVFAGLPPKLTVQKDSIQVQTPANFSGEVQFVIEIPEKFKINCLRAENTDGNIKMTNASVKTCELLFTTNTGLIEIDMLSECDKINLKTLDGDIHFNFATPCHACVELETISGSIYASFFGAANVNILDAGTTTGQFHSSIHSNPDGYRVNLVARSKNGNVFLS